MRYVIAAPITGDLAKAIEAFKTQYASQIQKDLLLPPHCTILATELDETKQEAILKEIKTIAISLELRLGNAGIDMFDENSLVLRLSKIPYMQLLHDRVCFAMKRYVTEQPESDPRKEALRKEFCSPYAGPNYRPHVTLFHPKEDAIENIDKQYFKGKHADINSLGIWIQDGEWKQVDEYRLVVPDRTFFSNDKKISKKKK